MPIATRSWFGFTVAGLEAPVSGTAGRQRLNGPPRSRIPPASKLSNGRPARPAWVETRPDSRRSCRRGKGGRTDGWPMGVNLLINRLNGDGFVPGQCTVGATDPGMPRPASVRHDRRQLEGSSSSFRRRRGASCQPTSSTPSGRRRCTSPSSASVHDDRRSDRPYRHGRGSRRRSSLPVAIRHLDTCVHHRLQRDPFVGDLGKGNGRPSSHHRGNDVSPAAAEIQLPPTYQSVTRRVRLAGHGDAEGGRALTSSRQIHG